MKKHFAFIVAAATILASCNTGYNDTGEYATTEAVVDSTSGVLVSEKMVKTADMRFRVKDVQQAKEDLSKAVKAQGGLVMEASINSQVQNTEKVKFSADSLKEITAYRKDGMVVAKIPSVKLDEFTNQIAKMAVFVDYQSLKLEDMSLAYLENNLKSENRKEAITQINKTASKKSPSVGLSLDIKDDFVERKIQNMSINNSVAYSTINLNFYQDNTVKTLIIANDNIGDYKPDFFRRLGLNLVDGWQFFQEFILFFSKLWMFFLLGFSVYFGVRYYLKNQKSKTVSPPKL